MSEIVLDQPAAFWKSWKRIRQLLLPIVMSENPSISKMTLSEKRDGNNLGIYTLEIEFFEMSSRSARF